MEELALCQSISAKRNGRISRSGRLLRKVDPTQRRSSTLPDMMQIQRRDGRLGPSVRGARASWTRNLEGFEEKGDCARISSRNAGSDTVSKFSHRTLQLCIVGLAIHTNVPIARPGMLFKWGAPEIPARGNSRGHALLVQREVTLEVQFMGFTREATLGIFPWKGTTLLSTRTLSCNRDCLDLEESAPAE